MESWEEPDAHSNDTRHCTVESLGGRGGAGAGDSTLVSPTWSVGGVTGQDPEDQACTLRRHRKTALWNLWGPGGPGDSTMATPSWLVGGVVDKTQKTKLVHLDDTRNCTVEFLGALRYYSGASTPPCGLVVEVGGNPKIPWNQDSRKSHSGISKAPNKSHYCHFLCCPGPRILGQRPKSRAQGPGPRKLCRIRTPA